MSKQLYQAIKAAAAEIASKDKQMGVYAQRKVNAVNAQSPLKVLMQVGRDLELMATKLIAQ